MAYSIKIFNKDMYKPGGKREQIPRNSLLSTSASGVQGLKVSTVITCSNNISVFKELFKLFHWFSCPTSEK